jgi:hypothetical protein
MTAPCFAHSRCPTDCRGAAAARNTTTTQMGVDRSHGRNSWSSASAAVDGEPVPRPGAIGRAESPCETTAFRRKCSKLEPTVVSATWWGRREPLVDCFLPHPEGVHETPAIPTGAGAAPASGVLRDPGARGAPLWAVNLRRHFPARSRAGGSRG